MFVCFCATPNILLTLITWSLGEIMHLVRVFPHLLLHSDWSDGGIFVSRSFHRPVVMWQPRSPVRFCSPLNCSDWPVSVISLLPPSLDLLQHSCSFLQLQLSRALCSFRGEKKDKILVRWERFYNRLLSFVPHAHAHMHSLEQRMVSGVATTGSCPGIRSTVQDSLRPLLLPLRVWAVLYSKVHTVSLERIFFRKFGVFNIRDTKRERNWLHSWEIKMGGDGISAGKIVLRTWIHSDGRIWGSSPAISSPNSKNCCTLLDLVNVISCTIATLTDILGSLISALFKDHS